MINAVYTDISVLAHLGSLASNSSQNAWEGAEKCR